MLVHADPSRPISYNQQQPTNHWQGLEEVVLQKVPHRAIVRDVPPGIEITIESSQPYDQHQGRQLRLVTNGDEENEGCAYQVHENLDDAGFEPQQGEEHENEQDAAAELHVLLRVVVSHGGQAGEETLALRFVLS